MANILIIDDERAIRNTLKEILTYENYGVEEAVDGEEGLHKLGSRTFDMVLCDIKMPKIDGLEFLEKVSVAYPDLPVIMISGHGNLETAVEAVRKGAFDYIAKPPDLNRLLITIRNGLDKAKLISDVTTLRRKAYRVDRMIGDSSAMMKIQQTIDQVAPTEARVLISGENGVGKELVARWLHEKSNRSGKSMIEVNCAAIPTDLIESELFGHEKGSFTSAIKQRIGKFEQADGGTLFLDEIGDMSMDAQAKVLRALQDGKITRVGGEKQIPVNVRVIAATNKDLLQEIEGKRFRMDLYHRLCVIPIHVPSLNERREDIPLLVDWFLEQICADYGIPKKKMDGDALESLVQYHWTGNIRELRNVVERLIILSGSRITLADVKAHVLR